MRILADENIPHSVVEILRKKDHDVVTLYELGKKGLVIVSEEKIRILQ